MPKDTRPKIPSRLRFVVNASDFDAEGEDDGAIEDEQEVAINERVDERVDEGVDEGVEDRREEKTEGEELEKKELDIGLYSSAYYSALAQSALRHEHARSIFLTTDYMPSNDNNDDDDVFDVSPSPTPQPVRGTTNSEHRLPPLYTLPPESWQAASHPNNLSEGSLQARPIVKLNLKKQTRADTVDETLSSDALMSNAPIDANDEMSEASKIERGPALYEDGAVMDSERRSPEVDR